jgi:hypothetical protein
MIPYCTGIACAEMYAYTRTRGESACRETCTCAFRRSRCLKYVYTLKPRPMPPESPGLVFHETGSRYSRTPTSVTFLEGQARAEMYISSGKHVGGFANSPDSKLHLLTHSPQKTSNKPSRPIDIQKIAMLHKAPMAIINTHISKGKRRTSIKKSRSQSR